MNGVRHRLLLVPAFLSHVPRTTANNQLYQARAQFASNLTHEGLAHPERPDSIDQHGISSTPPPEHLDDKTIKSNIHVPHVTVRRNAAWEIATAERAKPIRGARISRYNKSRLDDQEQLRNGGWHKRVETFEQLEYESDLAAPSQQGAGTRLVDIDFLRRNTEIWETLLSFRQRVYGLKGAAVIWERLSSLSYNQMPPIHVSEKLMRGFITSGFQDPTLLREFCEFLFKSYRLTGIVPPSHIDVYSSIIVHVLRTDYKKAPIYHELLEHFPPTKEQLCDLVVKASRLADLEPELPLLNTLATFCFELPTFVDMYDLIVPALCENGQFQAATDWHYALMRKDDLPSSALSVEALFKHLEQTGKPDQVQKIMRTISHRLQPTSAAPTVSLVQEKHDFQKMVAELEKTSPLYSIATPVFSDEFCARLLATRFFGVSTIINGLSILNVQDIGPSSVREILLRVADVDECDTGKAQEYFDLLSKAKISIGRSRFCRLVLKLVAEKNAQMLYDVAMCDQHPDELDNWRLQEKLLGQYLDLGNKRQFDRTLAVLLLESSNQAYDTKHTNMLFRIALYKRDDGMIKHFLEYMRSHRLPVTNVSRTTIFHTMLPERVTTIGERRTLPDSTNIDKFVNTMKFIMQGGTPIASREWDEAMRTLLFSGRIAEFQDLLVYLLKWYSDNDFRDSQLVNRDGVRGKPLQKVYSHWHTMIRRVRIMEIFAFGWYHMSQQHKVEPVSGATLEERAAQIAEHATLWPLTFLAKLRDLGFPVERSTVAEACKRRLWVLFSVGHRERKRNRVVAKHKLGDIKDYIVAMEHIWGQDLFHRTTSVEELATLILYKGNRSHAVQTVYKLRALERSGGGIYRKPTKNRYDFGAQQWTKRQLLIKASRLEAAGICKRVGSDFVIPRKANRREKKIRG